MMTLLIVLGTVSVSRCEQRVLSGLEGVDGQDSALLKNAMETERARKINRSSLPKEFRRLEELPPEDDGVPMFADVQPSDSEFWENEERRTRVDENGKPIPSKRVIDARSDSTVEIYRKMLAGMTAPYSQRSCEKERMEMLDTITAHAQAAIDRSDGLLRVLWTTPDVTNMKADEPFPKNKNPPAPPKSRARTYTVPVYNEPLDQQYYSEIPPGKPTIHAVPDGQYEDEDD